jgi:hypothetical protein
MQVDHDGEDLTVVAESERLITRLIRGLLNHASLMPSQYVAVPAVLAMPLAASSRNRQWCCLSQAMRTTLESATSSHTHPNLCLYLTFVGIGGLTSHRDTMLVWHA